MPMLYRGDSLGTVEESFCSNPGCIMFLIEVEE